MGDDSAHDLGDSGGYARRALERSSSVLAYLGTDLRFRYGNAAFARWLGREPSQVIGRTLREVLGPALYALNEAHALAALGGETRSFERAVPGPGGIVRDALATYSPHFEDGRVAGIVIEVADVTALKATHEALRRSEEQLRELFGLTPEAIIVADAEGRYIDANEACCELLGYDRNELLGRRFDDLIAPQEVGHLVAARAQLFAGERHADEWMLRRRDGSTRPVEVRAKFLSDGRRVGVFRDLDAHKRLLAAERDMAARLEGEVQRRTGQLVRMTQDLRLSEARLRGILDSAQDAIITADATHVIVQANPAAARMFRLTLDRLVGSPLESLVPERHRQMHRHRMKEFGDGDVRARHMGPQRDVMALRADGQEFPVEAAISHLTVDGQRLYTVIHRDITERRLAEEALRASKTKLELAMASMNDAVFISDADGRFVEFNDAFASFHRFADKAQCLHTLVEYPQILDVLDADGEPVPLSHWAVPRALRGEVASNVEFRLRRKDSGESWIGSYSFAPIRGADGSIVGSVVSARDITSIRQAQVDLESSHGALQRLIAAQDRVQEEERARIARELHDDLQQTLAAMRIDLGELGDRLRGQATGLTSLVAELDDLAAGAVVSTRRIVDDLRPQMLEDMGLLPALQVLAGQFGQRTGIAIGVEAPPELSERLLALPALATCLYRVAQEALNNVAKHSRASRVDIRLALTSDDRVALGVVDNGRGIQTTDRRKPESSGILGMHERVRAQGGVLRLDELPEGGTSLQVRVPLSDSVPDPAASDRTDTEQAPLPRLLGHAARQSLQGVIDALAGNVAVIDRQGIVRCVNRAWIEFGADNGSLHSSSTGVGADYLEVCRRAALADDSAHAILEGLTEVIGGRSQQFSCDYPCHSPARLRWFRMNVAPMSNGDVLVTHFLVREAEAPGAEAR